MVTLMNDWEAKVLWSVVAVSERAKKVQRQGGAVGGEGRDRLHVVADHGADPAAFSWTFLSSQQVRESQALDKA